MYSLSNGVTEDDKEAVKWYRLAAEQGNANAQHNLGIMYAKGTGVSEDNVMAYVWVNLAGSNGLDVSKPKGILEKILSQEKKSEAQSLSRQMKKNNPDIY
jgi:TPR repeat protein